MKEAIERREFDETNLGEEEEGFAVLSETSHDDEDDDGHMELAELSYGEDENEVEHVEESDFDFEELPEVSSSSDDQFDE